MKKCCVFIVLMCVLLSGFGLPDRMYFTQPRGWPQAVYDFSNNPLSRSKIELGRRLFYDPVLSADSSISCASCHSPFNAFAHVDHALSHGIHDSIGTRNAPALMNLAWQSSFMWDGAIGHLDRQALAPMANSGEMGESIEHILDKLRGNSIYRHLFSEAYGNDSINSSRMLKSLSQFMLTLVSCNSRYDSMLRNETHFTVQEAKGYRLYRQYCKACHTEPLMSNYAFENNGLGQDSLLRDDGRMKITLRSEDSLKFKVPTLRNIEYTYPYMHDGRFKKLRQVLDHYASGIKKSQTLSHRLVNGIPLSDDDKSDLLAFLKTLSDKSFLFDRRYGFPGGRNQNE